MTTENHRSASTRPQGAVELETTDTAPPSVEPRWTPPPIDTTTPSVARMYDFFLGGKDNYPVDRAAAARVLAVTPGGQHGPRANRQYLVDTVTAMAEAGITQFIDLGSGIPTSPNVHEVARLVQPDACVVYDDHDPIVLAHHRALLRGDARIATIDADLRDPASVLDNPRLCSIIDFSRPVGLLMIAVLHFVDVATAPDLVAAYTARLAPGSLVAITAVGSDDVDVDTLEETRAVYRQAGAPMVFRTREEFAALFAGLEPVTGPEDVYRTEQLALLGGLGRVR